MIKNLKNINGGWKKKKKGGMGGWLEYFSFYLGVVCGDGSGLNIVKRYGCFEAKRVGRAAIIFFLKKLNTIYISKIIF